MTLKEQAWQSGLVLLDETAEWDDKDWPPLVGGWRYDHASVVVDHTVVVMGGVKQEGITNSVLVLNLAEPEKQWREGPPMNQSRRDYAAVVCNGGIYVMGGNNRGSILDSIDWIDANNLLPPFSTTSSTHESHWTTLNCRLSTGRYLCRAVAVHNRYIVVVGGYNWRDLSSVEIIDTNNQIVTAGPSMTVPRAWCATAVIGRRIFVVGGCTERSVEYWGFPKPCYNEENKDKTLATVISSLSGWTTQSDLLLSIQPYDSVAMVAVGSCFVVVNFSTPDVEILDTNRNRMWNFPPFGNSLAYCRMVNVVNQIAVIGGLNNSACATFPLMDKHTWCFRRLCEQQPSGWYPSLGKNGYPRC